MLCRQPHLGPNEHNAALEQEDAAIVAHTVVQHRHANVAQAAAAEVGREQRGQRLPRVRDRVALEKVVFAAVAVARTHTAGCNKKEKDSQVRGTSQRREKDTRGEREKNGRRQKNVVNSPHVRGDGRERKAGTR
jgi:hypothetical protein